MSEKDAKSSFTLTQQEADRLIAEVKRTVEKTFIMPEAGEHNAEFHVRSDSDGETFTIAVFRGKRDAYRHSVSARITSRGMQLMRLCVTNGRHRNPDGGIIVGSHWHIYHEGFDDRVAFPADIGSPDFVKDTIALLNRFNVLEKPNIQERLI